MQYIRSHATEYHLSIDRVGAIGFSAGANLIADMTVNAKSGQIDATDPLDQFSSKPDFMILGYGSMRIQGSVDSTVVAGLPPTFMYGTAEDRSSNGGMQEMFSRLYRAGVSVEAHFFQNGIHGTGFALGDPILGQWTNLLHNWLAVGGFLTNKHRVALSGVIKLDGSPLVKGMVILTPVNDAKAPPEVRQDATRWISNSREPFMIKMMDKQSKGTLTDADKKEWSEYLRNRDLSPSIYKQRIYTRKHPGDNGDYIVDIKENTEILIEVFSK